MKCDITSSYSSRCLQQKSNETIPVAPYRNPNLTLSKSISRRNKMIKMLIPLTILFPFIFCALYLPWGEVKYRLQTIKDVNSGTMQNEKELITIEHDVEVRFDYCLGGICGEERDHLLCMVITGTRCEHKSIQSLDKFNISDLPFLTKEYDSKAGKVFDRLASFVVFVLSPYLYWTGRCDEAKNNMRYDGQVYLSFRITVISMFLICTIIIVSIVSIAAQIIQSIFDCSECPSQERSFCKNIPSLNMAFDSIVEFCNAIASLLSMLTPIIYFGFTRTPLYSSKIRGSYDAGFYATLALGLAIFCGDLIFPQTRQQRRFEKEQSLTNNLDYEFRNHTIA